MSGLAGCGGLNCSGSRYLSTSAPARDSDLAATRMATAEYLMARGSGLTIPRLDGVPREHQMWQGEQAAARTAAAFLKAGLASEEDWYRAQRNPFDFVKMTLNRWVAAHWATEIQEEFRLHLTLSTSLDRYFTDQEPGATSELYLTIEPESAGYVVLGPTLRMLETIHPRLPVTFAHTLLGSLNRWVRVYDWRDALERVDRLREWYEVDPPETPEEVQLPDIESSIPHCMKRRPLSPKTLGRIGPTIKDTTARHLVENLLDIERAATRVVRPVIDEDTGAMLADCGEPLPALLAVFEKQDAIEGQFDEESQGMLEVTPEPNLIIRLNGEDVESVRDAFDRLAACCETLACARRLMKIMPGNERPD